MQTPLAHKPKLSTSWLVTENVCRLTPALGDRLRQGNLLGVSGPPDS